MKLVIHVAVCVAVAASLARPAPRVALASERLRPAPCPSMIRAQPGQECYHFSVPEWHDRTDGRSIELFVVILRALNQPARREPIVFLNGGPGNAGHDLIDKVNLVSPTFRQDRDLIVIDGRGVGLSRPALICPELNSLLKASPDLIEHCQRELLNSGAILEAYDTLQSAFDLVELRQELGIPRWNLFAVSYGTRLALQLLRLDGQAVAAAVLDSSVPPAAPARALEYAQNQQRVFERLFAGCADDPRCVEAYPHLRDEFLALASSMTDSPIRLSVRHPLTREWVPLERTYTDFVEAVSLRLGLANQVVWVPLIIHAMYLHYTWGLPAPRQLLDQFFDNRDPDVFDNTTAYGYALLVYCREVYPFLDFEQLDAERAALYPYATRYPDEVLWRTACPQLGLPPADAAFQEPVVSDVPVLLLSGELDTLAPMAWTLDLARTLSRATVVQVPGFGHVATLDSCARRLAIQFLAAPDQALDTTCLDTRPRLPTFLVLS